MTGTVATPWLEELRDKAREQFEKLGYPTTHDEDWRFTNVAPIARADFTLWTADQLYMGPESVERLELEAAKPYLARYASFEKNAFVAENTSFLGVVRALRVPRNTVLDEPIEITYNVGADIAERDGFPVAVNPRTLIIVGAGSQCSIVETYKGDTGRYFTNAVTEIVAEEGAVVDHYKVQMDSPDAYHVATMQVQLGRDANFTSQSISLGAALARNDINAVLSEGTECTLNGFYLVSGTQHHDTHTAIDHAKPHGTSHELYKGILAGHANAVFNGKILVRKDAQKTDAKQTNKNLVLSEDATINTKPELQIFADDVRCTHGATIGQIDAESLFYLQARGIGRAEARAMLIVAFARDVLDRIKIEPLREMVENVVGERLARGL
jgi:Fe-S cluster assembly protein SufD